MINSAHTVLYAEDPEEARAFFRDVLEFPHVDAGGGWLIFAMPPSELGVHPAAADTGAPGGHHELYFMCDDVEKTVAELSAKGVEFTAPIEERRFGLMTKLRVPGAGEIGLYQPRHQTAYNIDTAESPTQGDGHS